MRLTIVPTSELVNLAHKSIGFNPNFQQFHFTRGSYSKEKLTVVWTGRINIFTHDPPWLPSKRVGHSIIYSIPEKCTI